MFFYNIVSPTSLFCIIFIYFSLIQLVIPKDHPLAPINLGLGDPAVFGNLNPDSRVIQALVNSATSNNFNGYTHSAGAPGARAAVAKHLSTAHTTFTADDIIITSGASQAILLGVQIFCNPGDTVLIPKPGFSLYETVAGHLGVNAAMYDLRSDKQWEVDFTSLENQLAQAKEKKSSVKCIVINNPGNPTGSNYSLEHINALVAFASKHHLPIIADEIYAHMVFSGEVFTPISDVCGDVPVFTIGGLAKQYLVPGWRIGWMGITDRAKLLSSVRPHLISLTQVVLGASTVVQNAIPEILEKLDNEYYSKLNNRLEAQAKAVLAACEGIKGLTPVKPQGAMYVMIGIDVNQFKDIANDRDFAAKLLTEQNVTVLPGACFHADNFIRIVYCAPVEKLNDFAKRLTTFCAAHSI